MRLGRGRQEVFSNCVVEPNGGIGQSFRNLFDLVIEILRHELMVEDIVEDPANLSLRREHEVDHGKLSLDATRDLVSTSSGRTHGSDELDVFNFFEDLVLSTVEPPPVVHPLAQKFERGL